MCFVNKFLYQNFSGYWKRDNDAKLEHHKRVVNYIPGGDEAKKLGLTEVRCETCKNFRGSKNWEKKHYYLYGVENYENLNIYEYQKDTAWFKLYTKKEKEKILEERLEEKVKREESNEIKCEC